MSARRKAARDAAVVAVPEPQSEGADIRDRFPIHCHRCGTGPLLRPWRGSADCGHHQDSRIEPMPDNPNPRRKEAPK